MEKGNNSMPAWMCSFTDPITQEGKYDLTMYATRAEANAKIEEELERLYPGQWKLTPRQFASGIDSYCIQVNGEEKFVGMVMAVKTEEEQNRKIFDDEPTGEEDQNKGSIL